MSMVTIANLKNQKAVIIQVNSFPFQFPCNFRKIAPAVIDVIFGGIISKCHPRNHEIASWDSFISPIILYDGKQNSKLIEN